MQQASTFIGGTDLIWIGLKVINVVILVKYNIPWQKNHFEIKHLHTGEVLDCGGWVIKVSVEYGDN